MKNLIRPILAVALFSATSIGLQAQVTFDTNWTTIDLNRDTNPVDIYDGVNGDPFLLSDWAQGDVFANGMAPLKNQMLKFDEVANRLLVKAENGVAKTFTMTIHGFTLSDKGVQRTFASGFASGANNDIYTFFEVLADGKKAKLLKRNIKVISLNKEYSGKSVKNVTSETKYFLALPEQAPIAIKLDEKSVLAVLTDKQTELATYAQANKLNLKKAVDVAKLVAHYNTL